METNPHPIQSLKPKRQRYIVKHIGKLIALVNCSVSVPGGTNEKSIGTYRNEQGQVKDFAFRGKLPDLEGHRFSLVESYAFEGANHPQTQYFRDLESDQEYIFE